MAVTSMSRNSIGFGQERSNRASGKDSNLDWCQITTTPTGSFSDADGIWNYWVFKTNGTLTVGRSGRVDYVVVAGGGTGNSNNTPSNVGAGGAGGVIVSPEFSRIDSGSYAITIGAGGASPTVTPGSNDGQNSSIGSLAVAVGGGGGGNRVTNGNAGGCGGGAGDDNAAGVAAFGGDPTFEQGFRGGHNGVNGGGGGGAGQNGVNGTTNSPAGGDGRIVTIIPTSVATSESIGEVSGSDLYFGGGGGGAIGGAGGLGGGGDGSPNDQRSVNCPANTGGGSGACDTTQGSPYAGAGGSGVVIVRTRV